MATLIEADTADWYWVIDGEGSRKVEPLPFAYAVAALERYLVEPVQPEPEPPTPAMLFARYLYQTGRISEDLDTA